MIRSLFLAILVVALTIPVIAQDAQNNVSVKTYGADVELLGYGASFGGFYAIHPQPRFRLAAETDWVLVESDETFSFNYYYQPIQINNKNLSMLKFLLDATYFPFIDSMDPSFQFGTFISGGPVLAMDTANEGRVVERWKDVKGYWSVLLRAGVHTRIRTSNGGIYFFRFGLDHSRFNTALDGKQTYSGVFFQAGLELLHR